MQLNSIYHLLDIILFTQGFIFGLIFIITSRKEKPTLFLGLFLICLVFGKVTSVLDLIFDDEIFDYNLIPEFFMFLTLPLFYRYAHKVSVIKEQKVNYRILILGVIEFIVLMTLMVVGIPYMDNLAFDIYSLIGLVFSVFIAIKTIRFANKHLIIIENQYASISGLQLFWVKQFIIVLLLNLATLIALIIFDYEWMELFLVLFDLVLVYWIIYRGMQQENVEPLLDQEEESYVLEPLKNQLNPKKLNIDDNNNLEIIVNTLDEYLEESKAYKQKNISIVDVSKAIDTSPKKVSKAINYFKDMNFNSYINSFRIKEAINYLQNPEFEHLSIEGIGNEAGFKSKSAFYNAFKKEKNCTPLALRKSF